MLTKVWPALALGVLLRTALILASPSSGMSGGDLQVYHSTAIGLASARSAWFEASEFGYRAPLYFIALAIAYSPFAGQAPYWVGQAVTSALFVPIVLIYRALGSQLGLSRRAVTSTVWLRSVLPTFVVSDVQVLSEPLFEVLLLGMLLVAGNALQGGLTAKRGTILGLLLAALVLTREVGSVFVLGLAFGCGSILRRTRTPWPWLPIACTLLAAAIPLAFWLYRNQVTYGQALPVSSTAGMNLHIGHHPDADGRWGDVVDPGHQPPAGLLPATPQMSRWHRDAAIAYMVADPVRALAIVPWKLGYLVLPRIERHETLAMFPHIPEPGRIALFLLAGLSSAALVILVPAGLGTLPGSLYRTAAIASALLLAAAVAVTYGSPRYLDPVVHLALPGVAALLVEPRRSLCRMSRRTRVTVLSCTAAIALLWSLILYTKI